MCTVGSATVVLAEAAGSMRFPTRSSLPMVMFPRANALSHNGAALSQRAMPLWLWRTCLHVSCTPLLYSGAICSLQPVPVGAAASPPHGPVPLPAQQAPIWPTGHQGDDGGVNAGVH
jgi:hypothetical protein